MSDLLAAVYSRIERVVFAVANSMAPASRDWWDELDSLPESFRLVPCDGEKRPIDPVTGNGLQNWTQRPFSVEQFKKLSREHVRAAGLLLGPVSGGIIAVDFDASGYELLFSRIYLGKQISDLPKSMSWTSGKPGRKQIAFKVPSQMWEQIRNRCSWKNNHAETAFELRWRNVQSIILGAHPDTHGYRWCDGCGPSEIDIAEAPAWLLSPVKKQQRSYSNLTGSDQDLVISRAREALALISPRNSYDEWLRVGMALHSADESMLRDWIEWSRNTNSFDELECIEKWESFTCKADGVTPGTLIYMAEEDKAGIISNRRQAYSITNPSGMKSIGDSEVTIMDAANELIMLHSAKALNSKELMPKFMVDALSVIRSTVKYDWDLLLVVLITGLSGALPLDSEIELIPGDFSQSLNLLAILLMDTGEVKSPLIKRLISSPWAKSVELIMKDRYLKSLQQWKQLKDNSTEGDGQFDIPRPQLVNTLITEDLTPQGLERHLVLHDQYARGSVLLLFDEGKDLLSEMSGQTLTINQLKLGTWILSRYDGSGARGAKADSTKERSYSKCRLSALICCQPDIYRQITGDSDQSGLAGRFIVVEQSTVDQEFPEEFPASHKVKHQHLADLLVALYTYACDRNELSLTLSDEARCLFQKERKLLNEQKHQTLSDAVRAQLNKAHGRLGRLAAILHILWSFNPEKLGHNDLSSVVGLSSMKRAIELNRHLLSTSVLARQTATGNNTSMQKIEAFHRRALKVKSKVKVSEIRKSLQSCMRASPADTEKIVNALDHIGVGKLSRDERGTLWYEALRSIK